MELPNLFGINPDYLTGLLGDEGAQKLKQRANTTGLINMAVGYLAQPKNQGLGSAVPYLARSYIAGQEGAQQTVNDTIRQSALQEQALALRESALQRQQDRDMAMRRQENMQSVLGEITDPRERMLAELDPASYVRNKMTPATRQTATVNGVLVDTQTGQPIYGTPELKARPMRERQVGRTKIQEELQPDGTYKEIGRGSMDAPQRSEAKALYSNTPTDTANGFVYMPTPEGMARGMKPIDATTGAPVTGLVSQKQVKEQEAQEKQQLALESTVATADSMGEAIGGAKQILQNPMTFTSGLVGGLASTLKLPARTTLEGYIDTLKANLSFEELKAMKAASPTGGALGAISENELRLLGSTVSSLNPDMPREQLLKNIDKIEKKYADIKARAMKDLGKEQIIPANATMSSGNWSIRKK